MLHLDVDLYESYWVALRRLWPHVIPGGIVTFDEYRQPAWPGATLAVDEFFWDLAQSPVRSTVTDLYYVEKQQKWD